MLKTIYQTLTTTTLLLAFNYFSVAQCTFHSATGYDVSVAIYPTNVVVSSTICPFNYQYNVQFSYQVVYSNNPSNELLNNLSVKVKCGSQYNVYANLPVVGGEGSFITNSNSVITANSPNNYGTNPNCNQASLSTLNCNEVSIQIQGPGIPNQTVVCPINTILPVGLPVEFDQFDVIPMTTGNQLSWSVFSEKRNDHFTLFYSENGNDWEMITEVKSLGDTDQKRSYTYYDANKMHRAGYYKLAQTDLDGKWNELSIAYVNPDFNGFIMSPNPTTGNFVLDYQAVTPNTIIRILTQEGKPIVERNVSYVDVTNCFYFHEEFNSTFNSGLYFVQIISGNQVVRTEKLVIQ